MVGRPFLTCRRCYGKRKPGGKHHWGYCWRCYVEINRAGVQDDNFAAWITEVCAEIGKCQCCWKKAAKYLWDSGEMSILRPSRELARGETVHHYAARMFDMTATCLSCARELRHKKDWLCSSRVSIMDLLLTGARTAYWRGTFLRAMEMLDALVESTPKPQPTEFPPGSPEKIEALRQRARAGQKLFADDDLQSPEREPRLENVFDSVVFAKYQAPPSAIARAMKLLKDSENAFEEQREARRAGACQATVTAFPNGVSTRAAV